MFGDPHFVTFDKADPVFMAKNVGSALNYFWAVNSAQIEIQGLSSGGDSWMQGVAITGGFLNGNSLIAVKDPSSGGGFKVLWNGDQILRSEGDSAHPMEHVQLYRNKAAQYLPTDDEFRKVFGVAGKKNWFQGGQVMRQWKGNKDVFSFALPKNVQIFLTVSQLPGAGAAEILIKMPPQGAQGGWCGNFNGNKGDDQSGTDSLGPLGDQENLFKKHGISALQIDDISALQMARTTSPCAPGTQDMAESACEHIQDEHFRAACITDICTSGDVETSLEAADDIGIMSIIGDEKKCECDCR